MLNIVKFILFICLLWPLQAVSNAAACIAVTLTKEAATEGLLGKRAVYDAIISRMKESGKTACQIIKEPHQFSWVTKDTKFIATKEQLTTYRFVSKMPPVAKGAKYFHNKSVKPSWAKRMRVKLKVKNHYFY
jgi:spore germination cell wall hydrolase CwlJ-like protein